MDSQLPTTLAAPDEEIAIRDFVDYSVNIFRISREFPPIPGSFSPEAQEIIRLVLDREYKNHAATPIALQNQLIDIAFSNLWDFKEALLGGSLDNIPKHAWAAVKKIELIENPNSGLRTVKLDFHDKLQAIKMLREDADMRKLFDPDAWKDGQKKAAEDDARTEAMRAQIQELLDVSRSRGSSGGKP